MQATEASSRAVNVRWMLTGDAACSVSVAHETSVGEVKNQVMQQIGVPTSEQRLFVGGEELPTNADVESTMATAGVSCQSLGLIRTHTDQLDTDLGHFWPESDSFASLPKGEFTVVRRLASGINGDVFMYRRRTESEGEETFAVKKLKKDRMERSRTAERNERKVHLRLSGQRAPCAEDAWTEVGVLKHLAKQADLPLYVLRLHDVFSGSNEMWLVTELCEGGELFAHVERNGALAESKAQTFTWEILQAVAYLHKHHIGHRDISLENILLKDGSVRVMDFGMAVRSTTEMGTPLRYFREVGKDFYRAPECYVPQMKEVQVTVPEGASAGDVVAVEVLARNFCEVRLPEDAVPGRVCDAEVYGYTVPPTDVFAVGVCLVIMLTGGPAWGRADLRDNLFVWVRERGLAELLRQWGKNPLPADAQALIDAMTQMQPSARPAAVDCLSQAWFQALRDEPVKLHRKSTDEMAAAGGA